MTTVVKNFGARQYAGGASLSKHDTIPWKTYGEEGTVRVWFENQQYVFGPNQSKSFSDDGIAAGVVAASGARLRVVDDRDGAKVVIESSGGAGISQPSCVVTAY